MNKFVYYMFYLTGITIHAGVFMDPEMRTAIDEASLPEHAIIGSDYLKSQHLRIKDYLEKYSSNPESSLRSEIMEYLHNHDGQASFTSLFLTAFATAVELSSNFERAHVIHPVNQTQEIVVNQINQNTLEGFMAIFINNLPPHLQYFKPYILLDYGTFALEDYFYALSKGMSLYTLPGTCLDDVHAGIFRSPTEIFNHDANHLYDTFGHNDEELANAMRAFCAKIVEVKNRNPENLDKSLWERAFYLLFVLSHEPPIFARFTSQNEKDVSSFIKFLERNLLDYLRKNCGSLTNKQDFYAARDMTKIITAIEEHDEDLSTHIRYSDGSERVCTMLEKYEHLKTLYCDYAKLLKYIFPDQELIPDTDSELDWDPEYVIKKYEEAFQWFWHTISPSFGF